MTTKDKKMEMTIKTGSIDVDSLIEGADPISSNISVKKEKIFPWNDISKKGKVSMPLYIDPKTKEMLDYLREKTGVPSQVLLRKIIEPAIQKEAERQFKKAES